MKTLTKLFLLAAMFGFSGIAFAQTAVTQTTISAAVNGGQLYSGTTQNTDTCFTLASVTNITAPGVGGTPQWAVYVDRELLGILTVNTTTKVVCGIRGYDNTLATPHAANAMALYAQVNLLGANTFFQIDPSGACTASATPSTPWINVLSGNQWLCSSITGTWVPGFGNPYPPTVTAAVASAAGLITPSGPLFHVTGTSAITGFNIPVGCDATAVASRQCEFTVIPDGVFTYTTANNIGLASTGLNAGTAVVVVNQPITFVWDAKNSKFLPNTQ